MGCLKNEIIDDKARVQYFCAYKCWAIHNALNLRTNNLHWNALMVHLSTLFGISFKHKHHNYLLIIVSMLRLGFLFLINL